jgi:hypothetical protein
MLKTSLLFLFYITVLSACSEEFDMNIPDISHRVVLEGAITNEEGPYFFKLSLSKDLSINKEGLGITDALIVISDNIGISDTLKLLPTSIQRHPKWLYYFISIKKYSGVIDTIRLIGGDTTSLRGIYYTTRIQGRPGNKYSLMINYKNSIIQAAEEMPSVPVIDSVQFREQFLEKDGQNYYVPFLYFKEPKDQTNFYMFNFGSDNLYNLIYGSGRVWNFSILNDTYLKEYVYGFNLDDGASPIGFVDFWYFNKGDKARIRMLSLSENAYYYYQALLKQFENDGGAYSPTPASPPSNLSGNALGYFRVSAVSEIDLVVN